MKLRLAIIHLLFTYAVYGQTVSYDYDPGKLYPVDSLKADLRFLQTRLEKMHPGLYRYATRAEITGLFDSLHRVIRRPMNEQQFLSLLMLVQARIRNGHTMFLPGEGASAYNLFLGRFLPFDVRMIGGRMLITQNYSADSLIGRGTEIIQIDGVSPAEVWRQLMAKQVRDGYNDTYPEWILDHYFSSYYGIVFGQPKEFKLGIRNSSGDTATVLIRALTRDSIGYFRRMRYPDEVEIRPAITLREIPATKAAVLTVRTFNLVNMKSRYGQWYLQAVDSVIHQVLLNEDSVVVLDLRDNQGGDFSAPCFLLARLIAKPTQFLVEGPESKLIRPARESFSGRLVVLVNGGSFSSTVMLAATLKRDRRAVFVGEETGGNPVIITGDPEEVVLPHSGISCQISTKTFQITAGVNTGHGLMPEYPVKPEAGDWLTGRDRAMEKAERLVNRE
jgi:hypothetical protein